MKLALMSPKWRRGQVSSTGAVSVSLPELGKQLQLRAGGGYDEQVAVSKQGQIQCLGRAFRLRLMKGK